MHGDAEARLPCSAEHALVFGYFEVSALAPCNIDPDDPAARPGDRLLHDDLVLSQRELAVKDQDDPRLHRILQRRTISPSDGGSNDVVKVLFAIPVALHRIETQLHSGDVVLPVRASNHFVDRTLHRDRR